MPLKIESGTYTVNPVAKKNVSKFLLWKHWRRRYDDVLFPFFLPLHRCDVIVIFASIRSISRDQFHEIVSRAGYSSTIAIVL